MVSADEYEDLRRLIAALPRLQRYRLPEGDGEINWSPWATMLLEAMRTRGASAREVFETFPMRRCRWCRLAS